MPTRSEHGHPTDAVREATTAAPDRTRCKLEERPTEGRRRGSRHRSVSRHSSSSSSSSTTSSSSSGSTSGTSPETGSSNSSSDDSDSGSSSGDSDTDVAAAGNRNSSHDSVAAFPLNRKRNSSNEDGERPRKRSHTAADGENCSSSLSVEPEIESKTASGREAVEILCLSPSQVEDGTANSCSEIPVEMDSRGRENGSRERIRIVLGGKLFPVLGQQLCASDSLRSISLYSDDEVDCNDDGRSLHCRPAALPRVIATERPDQVRHRDSSSERSRTESQHSTAVELGKGPESAVENSNSRETNDRETKPAAVSSTESQSLRRNAAAASANVDNRSRSPQRQRGAADRRTGQDYSREERYRLGSSDRANREPDAGQESSRHSRKSTDGGERARRSERNEADIVSADSRGYSSHHRTTAAERHNPRHESSRSGRGNEVSGSRSAAARDRRESRSRSPSRHRRDENGSSSRSHCATRIPDHCRPRAEVDERQRRRSRDDVTSGSGLRSERETSSRARPDVKSRCWKQDQVNHEQYDRIQPKPTVPQYCQQSSLSRRSD